MLALKIASLILLYSFHGISLSHLCPSRFKIKKTIAIWASSILVNSIVGILLISFLPAPLGINLTYTITVFLILGVEYFISQDKFSKTLFFLLAYAQAFTLTIFISGFLSFRFWKHDNVTKMIIFIILHFALTILCVAISKGNIKQFANGLDDGWWPLNLLSILLLIYLSYISLRVYSTDYRLSETIFFILLVTVVIAVYTVFFHTIHFMHNAAERQRAELQSQFLLRQMETMEQSIDEARLIRHDVRHHNIQMREYLQNREYDALQRYLEEYEKETQNQQIIRICDNLAANSILSAYLQNANKNNITVHLDVTLERDIGISDIDIVAILANLMENAIHGCLKSCKPQQLIDVYINHKAKKLVINVSNTARDDITFQNGIPKSKSKGGIGVASILHSVARYGGEYDFRSENGQFACQILLKIPEASQQAE